MQLEQFHYDNRTVKCFAYATIFWSIVGMLAGLWASIALFYPPINLGYAATTFGRMRPVHTNAVIFAFVGNGIFMGVYYSLQRLCKARMYSDLLSKIHFWGWQLIIVVGAITLPAGMLKRNNGLPSMNMKGSDKNDDKKIQLTIVLRL